MLSYLVQDYSNSIDRYVICSKCLKKCEKRYKLDDPDKNSFRFLSVDSVELNRFLLDLRCFPLYRLLIANFINDLWTSNHQRLVLKIHPPLKEPIDYAWGEQANQMMWERIELDELMSWLSTLGGAFSALGDYKLACADTAARISVQQMKLAIRLGEPSVIARCWLYMAIALIQKYEFAVAKRIVKRIYRKEKRQTEPDTRLMNMCLGIWSKLSYEYELYQKKLNRPKE
ncbi:AAEL008038-PB [Aedes aegypti]|uniref:AAEL008038-PB n=1 Tax=Aedes aegypti TaxID=7159 RepID=Q16ZW0_AEDAE|nr:AAEL008038-PB [Aedes aegypti]